MVQFDLAEDLLDVVWYVYTNTNQYPFEGGFAAARALESMLAQRQDDSRLLTDVAVAAMAVRDEHKRKHTAPFNHAQWRAVEAAERLVETLVYHSPRGRQCRFVRPSPWREGLEVRETYDPYDRATW